MKLGYKFLIIGALISIVGVFIWADAGTKGKEIFVECSDYNGRKIVDSQCRKNIYPRHHDVGAGIMGIGMSCLLVGLLFITYRFESFTDGG